MYTNDEIKADLDRLKDLAEALKAKYGPEFSCIIGAGMSVSSDIINEPDSYLGAVYINGTSPMLQQNCNSFIKSSRFIDSIIDSMEYAILKSHKENNTPDFMDKLAIKSLEGLKTVLIKTTDEYKEFEKEVDVEGAVRNLLENSGFITN
jgi:hypothetical protein